MRIDLSNQLFDRKATADTADDGASPPLIVYGEALSDSDGGTVMVAFGDPITDDGISDGWHTDILEVDTEADGSDDDPIAAVLLDQAHAGSGDGAADGAYTDDESEWDVIEDDALGPDETVDEAGEYEAEELPADTMEYEADDETWWDAEYDDPDDGQDGAE